MKNLTLFPMSSYRSKVLGLIITFIGLVLLAIVAIHGPIQSLHKPAGDRQFNFFMAVLVVGMYFTAFSKEKVDDERVHIIRAKAMQMALGLLAGSIAAISLCMSLVPKPGDMDISIYFSWHIWLRYIPNCFSCWPLFRPFLGI